MYPQNNPPSPQSHTCLTNRDTWQGHPVIWTSVKLQFDAQQVERWCIETFDLSERGAIVRGTKRLVPISFCPNCGAFLLAESDLAPLKGIVATNTFESVPTEPASDADEGEDAVASQESEP